MKRIERKHLPAPVRQAFERQYPGASVKGILQNVKKKEGTTYSIECVDSAVTHTLLYQPDGTLVETKESTPPGDLPEIVLNALRQRHPSAVIRFASTVRREGHTEYELAITARGRRINVVVNSAGKLFNVR